MSDLKCWRCGTELSALSLPFSRMDECPECSISLHVCKMCSFYDPDVALSCREDDAEEVKEKERPNFCDYFQPSETAFDSITAAADAKARSELDSLFGEGVNSNGEDPEKGDDPDLDAAEDLFK